MNPITQRLSEDGLSIFLFHGVVKQSRYRVRNYTGKHILASEFAQIVAGLAHRGSALSMDEVIAASQEQRPLPPKSFAVTFDDGFANNYHVAAPILADFDVPATFYVTTGFVDSNAMAWIDRIEFCMEHAEAGQLRLPWNPAPTSFRTVEERIRALDEIRWHAKREPALDVEELVSDIFAQCKLGQITSSSDDIDQKMTWAQVRDLNGASLFLVGGHTHHHAILSFLSSEKLEWEVSTSLGLLQQHAGVGPKHYSYPEGLAHCYNAEVIAALKRHGVQCCPTAQDGVNPAGANLFHLRRMMVG